MHKNLLLALMLFITPIAVTTQPYASADTAYFYAEVANIDVAKTGRVYVTVIFTGKERLKPQYGSEPYVLLGYPVSSQGAAMGGASSQDCKKSAALIDNQGNEFLTNRCQTQLMRLKQNTKSSFVYEFSTPSASGSNAATTYSLIIPIIWTTGLLDGSTGETSLSFFKLKADK